MTMRHGLVDQSEKFKKRIASADTSAYRVVGRGQLVVGFPIDEGVLSFQEIYDEAIVSPAYEIWNLATPDKVSSEYLERFLRSPRALSYYATKLQGSTARRRSLPRDVFLALPVPLPDYEEQKRIVAVLDQLNALRAKRREAIDLLDDLTRSIFLDMFGDPAGNPKKWPVVTLGSVIVDGPSNGLYKPSGEYGAGVPILRIDSFQRGVLADYASWRRVNADATERVRFGVASGDIVINRVNSRSHLGKAVLIPELPGPAVYESNMMRFRVDGASLKPSYLVHFMQSGFVKGQILESAKDAVNQSSINQGDVKRLRVNLPPLAVQEEFLRKAAAIDLVKNSHRAHLTSLDELFTSLQQRAFSGRLWEAA